MKKTILLTALAVFALGGNQNITQGQAQQKPNQSQQQQVQAQQQSQSQQQIQMPKERTGKVGPNWQIGMRWFVQTQNLQSQQTDPNVKPGGVVWMFHVIGENQVEGRDCFQVKVQCEDKSSNEPLVYIWVDKATGMLVKTTTQVFVQGQWRNFTETYLNRSGNATAVLGSIPSLPLDMPLFSIEPGSKNLGGMAYEIVAGDTGSKSVGNLGFACLVSQTLKPISVQGAKTIEGAKSLDGLSLQEAIEVEMQGSVTGGVKQVWTPDTPWPIYSTNSSSVSQLISVEYPQE